MRLFAALLLIVLPLQALAVPLRWELQGVTFDDGGVAEGWFVFDQDDLTIPQWEISVSGGTTMELPAVTYSNATGSAGRLFNGGQVALSFGLDGVARRIRLGLGVLPQNCAELEVPLNIGTFSNESVPIGPGMTARRDISAGEVVTVGLVNCRPDRTTVNETEKLVPAQTEPDSPFAGGLAIDSDHMIAAGDDAVHIFERAANGVWTERPPLLNTNFDGPVDISGDTAIAGSSFQGGTGAAYVLNRVAGDWQAGERLRGTDLDLGSRFGRAVAIDGDLIVVGDREDDELARRAGAAYVFQRTPQGWFEQVKLLASDGAGADQFGHSVAISGTRIVVGAYWNDNIAGANAGAAYVFERQANGDWLEVDKLVPTDAQLDMEAGRAVAIDGDTIVVGARVNSEPASPTEPAYIFERNAQGEWLETAKLVPLFDQFEFQFFPAANYVAVSGQLAAVGAVWDVEQGTESGAVYMFERQASGEWIERAKLLASDGRADGQLGFSVAMSGDTVIAGASLNDQPDATLAAVYVFDVDFDRLFKSGFE